MQKYSPQEILNVNGKYQTLSKLLLYLLFIKQFQIFEMNSRDPSQWRDIYKYLMTSQPNRDFACTAAVFSPLSESLEWFTLPCNWTFPISTLICQRDQGYGKKYHKARLLDKQCLSYCSKLPD